MTEMEFLKRLNGKHEKEGEKNLIWRKRNKEKEEVSKKTRNERLSLRKFFQH